MKWFCSDYLLKKINSNLFKFGLIFSKFRVYQYGPNFFRSGIVNSVLRWMPLSGIMHACSTESKHHRCQVRACPAGACVCIYILLKIL